MNRNLAREIIQAVFRSGSELEKLIGVLKDGCSPEDYKSYVRQVATAIDGIHVALLDPVLSRYPELNAEIEANIARTGRAMP
ncbi:MAG TPA: hypothetical protein VIE87_14390 [Pseudolabrys sp.]|jgi:hypothetical protein